MNLQDSLLLAGSTKWVHLQLEQMVATFCDSCCLSQLVYKYELCTGILVFVWTLFVCGGWYIEYCWSQVVVSVQVRITYR